MKREVILPAFPMRIISLVPSQTELLYYLGLEKEVVGITKFCIHPDEWYRIKDRVGGTKSLDIEKIRQLKPDLIIGFGGYVSFPICLASIFFNLPLLIYFLQCFHLVFQHPILVQNYYRKPG